MRPGLYAFALAAAFLGATIYIGLVEQPARLRLNGRAMISGMETEQSARHAGVVGACCPLGHDRLHPVQDEWRRPLDRRRPHHSGVLAVCLFRDDADEYLALRHSTREAGFADPEADAGLGASRMGKRRDRICCLLRIRLAAGDAALIDGHQCRRVVLRPTSPDGT